MKRVLMGLMALAALAGCQSSSVSKEEEYVKLKPRNPRPREARPLVAILEFTDKSNYGQNRLGSGAQEVLITELTKSQQVRLLERTSLNKVLDEMKLQHSGITDPATAVKVGKALNAKYVVLGAVTNFGMHVEANDFIIAGNKTQIAECEVDVRIVEVETMEILYAMNGNGKATKGVSGTILGGGRSSFDEKLAGQSFRAAVVKMLDDMLDQMD
jgi:curli biogenesis system outer membrane secretion channel CsgG